MYSPCVSLHACLVTLQSYFFYLLHSDNKAINPRGCVISNCLGCVYHDKALTYPPKSCQDKKDCIKPTGIDEACMRSWAWCLRRDFKSKVGAMQ